MKREKELKYLYDLYKYLDNRLNEEPMNLKLQKRLAFVNECIREIESKQQ